MKFLTLTAIALETVRVVRSDEALTGAQEGGVDDLELPVNVLPIRPEAPPVAEMTFETFPIVINVDAIREFYPRKHNQPGTRVVFANGAAQVVTQGFDEVKAMLGIEAAVVPVA